MYMYNIYNMYNIYIYMIYIYIYILYIVKEGNSYAGQFGGKFLRTYFYP